MTWLAVSVATMLAAATLSICIGGQPSSLQDVWHAVFAPDGSVMDVTIRELRWPRTVMAVLTGICLGLAGTLVQGHTRNPVADPGLLGINWPSCRRPCWLSQGPWLPASWCS
jgi:iron complex transport system permease protein